MNIFKKALIVALSVGLISVPTVTKEVEAADDRTIYLNANTSYWNKDGAKFDAWVWGSSQADKWIDFVDYDGDGVYVSSIPSDATGIKFIRRGPNQTSHSWDDGQKWNNTGDQTISKDKNCFKITSWDNGQWEDYNEPDWQLRGSFNDWKEEQDAIFSVVEGKDYTYSVTYYLEVGNTFKFSFGDWKSSFGYSQLKFSDSSKDLVEKAASDDNIQFKSNGTFTFVLDVKNKTVDIVCEAKYKKFDKVKAELGFGYTYDSETNVLQDVTYANLRFSTPSLVATNFDVDTYGMNITLCTAEEDLIITKEWTNEDVVKSGDNISWSAVVMNIPSTYFTTTIKVECFVKVGTYSFVISNTREVTVAGLAQTYIDRHNDQNDELVLSSFELAGCQKIIGTNAAN